MGELLFQELLQHPHYVLAPPSTLSSFVKILFKMQSLNDDKSYQ